MKKLYVLSVIETVWSDTMVPHRLSLLIMTQVTTVPISSLSTMKVNVDDW